MYLDYAEDQAERHIPMSMEDWKERLDVFLQFNEREVLNNPGKVTHKVAESFALSEFEKELIVKAFGLSLSDEQEYPVSYALNELVKMFDEDDVSRSTWVNINETFIEIGLYSGAANYCLLERMNKDTGATACYAADYLEKLVENYQYEGIDSELAEAIFHKVRDDEGSTRYNSTLNNIFLKYIEEKLVYNNEKILTLKKINKL